MTIDSYPQVRHIRQKGLEAILLESHRPPRNGTIAAKHAGRE
jgi:hypothetical protein